MWQKIVAFFTMIFQMIAGLFGLSPAVPVVSQATGLDAAFCTALISSEADYVCSLALPNGAVAMTAPKYDSRFASTDLPTVDGVPGSTYCTWDTAIVNPYFAASAVYGLMAADASKARSVAEGFINWYFSSMNTADTDYTGTDGTIYDFRVFVDKDNPQHVLQLPQREFHAGDFADGEKNTYSYDSSDSYGAMLLSVLASYCRIYGDSALVAAHRTQVDRVLSAVLATYYSSIGLFAAKPDHPICYLMDNCEVYAGLNDAAYLYSQVFGDASKAEFAADKAATVKKSIEKYFYNKLTGHYHAATDNHGIAVVSATDSALNNFYSEGTSQLFPIIFGVVAPDSDRAKAVYADFCSRFVGNGTDGMDWSALKTGSFPWTVLSRACALMKDYDTLITYLNNVKATYIDNNHSYPYYSAEAGGVLSALALSDVAE